MSERNMQVVAELFAAWKRGDYSATDWAHPEIDFVMEGEFFPDPGTYRGVESMTRAWTRWLGAWEGFRTSEPELIDLGDRVVGLYSIHGRGRTSGVEVQAPVANVFTFRAGEVVRLELVTRELGLKAAGIEE
jgi:ketosteroid isomerase-like protein